MMKDQLPSLLSHRAHRKDKDRANEKPDVWKSHDDEFDGIKKIFCLDNDDGLLWIDAGEDNDEMKTLE